MQAEREIERSFGTALSLYGYNTGMNFTPIRGGPWERFEGGPPNADGLYYPFKDEHDRTWWL